MNLKQKFLKLIQKTIKREDIPFSDQIPISYYLMVINQRLLMLVRGLFKRIGCKKCGNYFWVGKNVHIYCKNKITIGSGVSLKNNVFIDALSKEGVSIGDNSSIGERTQIKVSGSLIEIGKRFSMGQYSSIANDCFFGSAGGISIGDYVAIGQNVRFHSENHGIDDSSKMFCFQKTTHKGIKVGDDCWIGAGSVFLDGSSIGNHCVVGANAVVTKKFPNNVLIAGVPAKIVRYLK